MRKGVDGAVAVWKVVKEGFLEEEILDGAETGKEEEGLVGHCHLWNTGDRDRLGTL